MVKFELSLFFVKLIFFIFLPHATDSFSSDVCGLLFFLFHSDVVLFESECCEFCLGCLFFYRMNVYFNDGLCKLFCMPKKVSVDMSVCLFFCFIQLLFVLDAAENFS